MDQWLNLPPWPNRRTSAHQPSPLGPSTPSPITPTRMFRGPPVSAPAAHQHEITTTIIPIHLRCHHLERHCRSCPTRRDLQSRPRPLHRLATNFALRPTRCSAIRPLPHPHANFAFPICLLMALVNLPSTRNNPTECLSLIYHYPCHRSTVYPRYHPWNTSTISNPVRLRHPSFFHLPNCSNCHRTATRTRTINTSWPPLSSTSMRLMYRNWHHRPLRLDDHRVIDDALPHCQTNYHVWTYRMMNHPTRPIPMPHTFRPLDTNLNMAFALDSAVYMYHQRVSTLFLTASSDPFASGSTGPHTTSPSFRI